jgi:D-glycerate 3-kinase
MSQEGSPEPAMSPPGPLHPKPSEPAAEFLQRWHLSLAGQIAAWHSPGTLLNVGICGPQGSGKSTLVDILQAVLRARGLKVAVLSIDDLYLTFAQRQELARNVHPLLATRGVPGTHSPALGLEILQSFGQVGTSALPRFDKSIDDRAPMADWTEVTGPVDILLFEGWCVGARAQPQERLVEPINDLERIEDPDGQWRRYVNSALAIDYPPLFSRLDRLIQLRAPDFETVLAWRQQQEAQLRSRLGSDQTHRAMSDRQVVRFVAHYERLTRWIDQEMPERADVVINLNAQRLPSEGSN